MSLIVPKDKESDGEKGGAIYEEKGGEMEKAIMLETFTVDSCLSLSNSIHYVG